MKRARYPFIIPVVNRGRKPSDSSKPKGMHALVAQKHKGWAQHTLTNKKKQKTQVQICIHCRNWKGAWNGHGRQTLLYAFWGIDPKNSSWVFQTYRSRFGIETSYRQMSEARIRTSTRNPVMRLLFFGIAMLVRNLWVWLHFQMFAAPRKGGRILNLKQLRFKTLLIWLIHIVEEHLGCEDIALGYPRHLT